MVSLAVLLVLLVPAVTSGLNFSDTEVLVAAPPVTLPPAPPVSPGRPLGAELERDLRVIDDFSRDTVGTRCLAEPHATVRVHVDTARYREVTGMADTVAEILSGHGDLAPEALLAVTLRTLQPRLRYLLEARSVALNPSSGAPLAAVLVRPAAAAPGPPAITVLRDTQQLTELVRQPWYLADRYAEYVPGQHLRRRPGLLERGVWTFPYRSCRYGRWLLSYTVRVPRAGAQPPAHTAEHSSPAEHSVNSFISFDVDVSRLDINQCDVTGSSDVTWSDDVTWSEDRRPPEQQWDAAGAGSAAGQLDVFRGSHKCHQTTQCLFTAGRGWTRGAYVCRCRPGYYAPTGRTEFDGASVEAAFEDEQQQRRQDGGASSSSTYQLLYVCRPCAPGCGNCTSDQPCMAAYNWVFRIVLLSISMLCVLMTFIVIGLIVRYKRLKVIKAGSPIFLAVTLLGCVAMYMEMAAIFPVLDMYSCVATKWTRHMGFCLTYSALLLKTWRVSLTYRVKSAHKLKLTDKQLLQWLFPILLIMIIYLSSWTVSDPPGAVLVADAAGLQFRICEYGWWDHSLAAGELLFLFWGIKVCVNVRNAQTLYDEAKYISWAIYNIAIVNIAMATVHVFITSGPDVKYLLGFVRTQLSTTTTIVLILAPKFYRIAVGQGDEYDARAQARGAAASFYLNGIEPDEEDITIYRENEELKEEVQKLAAQIEFMKIVHMEANNRHLKPRREGYFSQSVHGRRKSSMGAALRLETYTSLPPDAAALQTGHEV